MHNNDRTRTTVLRYRLGAIENVHIRYVDSYLKEPKFSLNFQISLKMNLLRISKTFTQDFHFNPDH